MSRPARYFAPWCLTPEGWQSDCMLGVDGHGIIETIEAGHPAGDMIRLPGPVIPGMTNVHSHAHQRLIVGLTGRRGSPRDSFWSWREQMYRAVRVMNPERLADVAAWLYAELLEGGYTSVGEFHYLHHQADGKPYDDPAAMSRAIVEAAGRSGMALTLLPVWYRYGGFGRQAPDPAQAPFLHDPAGYARLLEELARASANGEALNGNSNTSSFRLGLTPHSLRAVDVKDLSAMLEAFPGLPVHIHIAEQPGEVRACREHTGMTPIQLLDGQAGLDSRWCLIHATHASGEELKRMTEAGVVAGLCPTTEADLGDGIFPAVEFLQAGGQFAIGSDSNLRSDAAEELRLLEWSQRYRDFGRNLLLPASDSRGVGERLWAHAARAGAAALDQPAGRLEVGLRADWVVLDTSSPLLAGLTPDQWMDGLVFSGSRDMIDEVWAGGRRLVSRGRHLGRDGLRAGWDAARRALIDDPLGDRRSS